MNPETLETLYTQETSGISVFSLYQFQSQILAGCFEGHLYVFDGTNDFNQLDYKKLTQGIYDIKEFATDDGRPFLVFA